jgi:hypothetical protein
LECSFIARIVPILNKKEKTPKIINNKATTDIDVFKWLKFEIFKPFLNDS